MADTGTDFQGLPLAGALLPTDVVPIQRGEGEDSTLKTTIADILANAGSGAQTGDLLLTVRAPEGSWLEQDSVYLQSEYPELFALVGLLPDAPPGRLWTAATSPGVITAICRVTDDIAVAVGNNTVWRTTDGTATWTAIPVVGNLLDVKAVNGVLMACGTGGVVLRSTDQGATWSSVASGTTQTLQHVLVMSQSVVLVAGNAGTVRRSVDAGLTFAAVTGFTSATYDKSVRFSPLVAIIYQAVNFAYRTVDAGATWTAVTLTDANVGSAQQGYVFDSSTAVIPAANGNWLRTINQGESWTVTNVSGMPSGSGLIGVSAKRAAWPQGFGSAGYVTDDAGLTWTSVGSVYGRFGAALNKALLYSYDKSDTTAAKSRAEYAYDTATMFKTPMIGDVRGYIKP